MLDKHRKRRMNTVLNGLGAVGDVLDDFTGDIATADVQTDYVGDVPLAADEPSFVGDIPLATDAPPVESPNPDLIGKLVKYGPDVFKFVATLNNNGRTVATPVRMTAAGAAKPSGKLNVLVPLGVLAALLLFR
jgi:hypothetical protein